MANECLPIVLRIGDAVQQGTIFPFPTTFDRVQRPRALIIRCRMRITRKGIHPKIVQKNQLNRSPPRTVPQLALHTTQNPARHQGSKSVADDVAAVEDSGA